MRKSYVSLLLTLVFSVGMPLISLIFTNIYLPNILSSSDLSEWRLISAIIAFAGLLHLGIADGFYLQWLSGTSKSIGVNGFTRIIIIIGLVSLLITAFAFLFFHLNFEICALLWPTLIFVSLMSFSVYYVQIFSSGFALNLALVSQSVLFIFLIFVVSHFIKLESGFLIIIYCISCLPVTYLALAGKMVDNNVNNFDIQNYMKMGFPIVLSNVGIIAFTNIDKIVARYFINSDINYARYTIQSSLFVAGVTLGISAGGILISRGFQLKNSAYRLIGLFLFIALSFFFSKYISDIMNLLIKKYTLDYNLSILLSGVAFYTFLIYFSSSRIYMQKYTQVIFYSFPLTYLVFISVILKGMEENFYRFSFLYIIGYLLMAIMVYEILDYKNKNGKII